MSTILARSSVIQQPDVISLVPTNLTDHLTATIFIKRQQNLKEYADKVIQGVNDTLTHSQFYELFSVSDTDIALVVKFATDANLIVEDSHAGSATVKVSGDVGAFNAAFSTTLLTASTLSRSYRTYTGELSIPNELDNIIEFVLGLDTTVVLNSAVSPIPSNQAIQPQSSSVTLTPQQVTAAYNFPANDGYGGCIGIVEFGGGYTTANVNASFAAIGLPAPTIVNVFVNGGTNTPDTSSASAENMLDIFVIGGAVPAAKLVIYFAPNSLAEFANCFNAAIHDTVNYPSVVSVSWAANEMYWGTYATAVDTVLQSAAILGITFCIASGDYGSESYNGDSVYTVNYPASSPYALGVGGTTLQLTGSNIANEFSWNQGNASSGGGVSTIYAVPSWQTGLTSTKYPIGSPTMLTGRGIPDICANADWYTGYVFYYGSMNSQVQSGGTSGAAPMIAALILRLNILTEKRLGFVNPLFYANPSIFNDITSGNNAAPNSQGFAAVVGWDACTGLGSPNGSNIFRLVNVGAIFPTRTFGFRSTVGAVYPRTTSGVRTD